MTLNQDGGFWGDFLGSAGGSRVSPAGDVSALGDSVPEHISSALLGFIKTYRAELLFDASSNPLTKNNILVVAETCVPFAQAVLESDVAFSKVAEWFHLLCSATRK